MQMWRWEAEGWGLAWPGPGRYNLLYVRCSLCAGRHSNEFWQHLTHCDRWTERRMDIMTCRGAIAANKMFYLLFVFIYYQIYSM